MIKIIHLLIFTLLGTAFISAQVGINTENPKATLHIQMKKDINFPDGVILPRISGDSLTLKDETYTTDQNGLLIFVTSPANTPSLKTQNIQNSGLYIYDGYFTHANSKKGIWYKLNAAEEASGSDLYAMKAVGPLGLLDLGINLLGSKVYAMPIVNTSNSTFKVDIPSSQIHNNAYVVPKDGVYAINYSYRTGQGVRAELLSGNRPGAIILKTNNSNTTTLDYRMFGGVQLLDLAILGLINISLTEAQISHVYTLAAGDILNFGIVRGGLNLGVLQDASAELSIYKIR